MTLSSQHIQLFGCGRMGSNLVSGWLNTGLNARRISVSQRNPSEWLTSLEAIGVGVNLPDPPRPSVVFIALDPVKVERILPQIQDYRDGKTLFISIATGLDLASLENFLGPNVPIVRATTSLPAMVGAGVTALVGNAHAGRHGVQIADRLLAPLGQTLLLANEDQMHAVGAIAGSGPACMFALAEGLGRAAESLGLPQSIARRLATTMVSGCGQLLATGDDTTDELRDELVYRSDIAAAALEQLQIHQISVDQLALETSLAVFERSRGSGEGPGGGIYIEGGADLKTA